MNDADRLDAALVHHGGAMTAGMDSLNALDPFEVLCRLEAGEAPDAETWGARNEGFNALMVYLLERGPDPEEVARRFRSMALEVAPRVVEWGEGGWAPGVLGSAWKGVRAEVEAALRRLVLRRGRLGVGGGKVSRAWEVVGCLDEPGRGALKAAVEWFAMAGPAPLHVVRRVLIITKSLKADVVRGMSLEEMAVLCLDGGRATVCARGKRDYNATIERVGARKVKAPHQKSPEAVANMAQAQKGNRNRQKRRRRRSTKN